MKVLEAAHPFPADVAVIEAGTPGLDLVVSRLGALGAAPRDRVPPGVPDLWRELRPDRAWTRPR